MAGSRRHTIRGWIIFGRSDKGHVTPVRVITNQQDAFDFGHKMMEQKGEYELAKYGLKVIMRPIDIDIYKDDICK